MKRRSFLQSLAGFVGLAVAPTLPAKTKELPTPINISDFTPKPYFGSRMFDHLTIDHFGASDTKTLSQLDKLDLYTGLTWYSSAEYFPPIANKGDAFYFDPKQYHGYTLDEKAKRRLDGGYVFNGTKWLLIATNNS